MKRANSGSASSESTWQDQSVDNMSPTVRAKFDAWRKAVDAERAAKKALDDHASAKARAAKVISVNEYVCYGMGRGNSSGFYKKKLGDSGKKTPKSDGPSF
jgi:hypothetical protein